MKTTARQIAIDMYKCKDNRFENLDQLCQKLTDLVKDINFEISDCTAHKFDEDHLSVCIFFPEGSIVVHAYSQLDYVAADLYLCQENATPERYFNELKKLRESHSSMSSNTDSIVTSSSASKISTIFSINFSIFHFSFTTSVKYFLFFL